MFPDKLHGEPAVTEWSLSLWSQWDKDQHSLLMDQVGRNLGQKDYMLFFFFHFHHLVLLLESQGGLESSTEAKSERKTRTKKSSG